MAFFNLSERQLFVLNLIIGLMIIPFLALCINDGIRIHLANNVMPAASEYARGSAAVALSPRRPRAYYDTIVQRDIFELAPPPASAPVENETLQVKLVGTSEISSHQPYAIVEDPMGTQTLYRVGDTIPNAGQLVEVAANRAVIFHNGHRVGIKIELQTPTPGAAFPQSGPRRAMPLRPGARPGGAVGGAGVHPLGTNRFLLDRAAVDDNLKNMAPLFTQIRATPNLVNGAASGYRLTEIQPNSIFQQIGLRDGDLLNAVNGQKVGDPAKAMTMLQGLQSQSSITLNVMRNGAPVQLFYNIR